MDDAFRHDCPRTESFRRVHMPPRKDESEKKSEDESDDDSINDGGNGNEHAERMMNIRAYMDGIDWLPDEVAQQDSGGRRNSSMNPVLRSFLVNFGLEDETSRRLLFQEGLSGER